MRVDLFHEILIWPLRLEEAGREHPRLMERERTLDNWGRFIEGPFWKRSIDLFSRGMCSFQSTRYSEYVYFHPFVQRFLYGDDKTDPALRLFARRDIGGMRIGISGQSVDLKVERVHLYLDARVALLVVEVSAKELPLELVEDLQDRVRRVYPPFFSSAGRPGLCPESVQWLDERNKPYGRAADYLEVDRYLQRFKIDHVVPVAAHWQFLLEPLLPFAPGQPQGTLTYKQVEDERMQAMSYLAVRDPFQITRDHFVRLALYDSHGDEGSLPYSEEFLGDFERAYCYDRYWDRKGGYSTRILCSGYGFTMIGDSAWPLFVDKSHGLLAHFRHHYFQLGLIVHFQKASLLVLVDRLYHAVTALAESGSMERFRRLVQKGHEDVIEFTSRSWFMEASNQVQPRELFKLWGDRLGTEALYSKVMREMASVNEVLQGIRQRGQNESLLVLTVVATCGLALSLTVNFLGMGDFIARGYEELFQRRIPWPGWIQGWLIFVLTALGFFCFVLSLKSLCRLERFRGLFEHKDDGRQ